MKSSLKKSLGFRQMLAAGAAVLSMTVTALVPAPAYAQFGGIVYDPSNYSQNILTAARTLEQINNQIRQLQNQATSLINEARNLQSLPLTMLAPLQQQIQQTQQLLARAQGDAASFDKVYEQYKLAPEVTKRRMYYETMERVLGNNDKIIMENKGVTPYLPLPDLRKKAESKLLMQEYLGQLLESIHHQHHNQHNPNTH